MEFFIIPTAVVTQIRENQHTISGPVENLQAGGAGQHRCGSAAVGRYWWWHIWPGSGSYKVGEAGTYLK